MDFKLKESCLWNTIAQNAAILTVIFPIGAVANVVMHGIRVVLTERKTVTETRRALPKIKERDSKNRKTKNNIKADVTV